MSLIAHDRLPTKPIEVLRELVRAIDECDDLKRETVTAARAGGRDMGSHRQGPRHHSTVRLGRSTQPTLHLSALTSPRNAANNSDLGEDEALDIAVEEVRQVRRARRAS